MTDSIRPSEAMTDEEFWSEILAIAHGLNENYQSETYQKRMKHFLAGVSYLAELDRPPAECNAFRQYAVVRLIETIVKARTWRS
jgi:hypothetical protein